MSLFSELKRCNVLRVGAAYIVVAWLIIQVAETLFPLFGFGDGPARIVVIVLAIGFIPVLIISWVFELTPDGLKRDGDVDPEFSAAPHTGKKLDRTIMVVLVLALAYFGFDKFVLDPQRDIDIAESATRAGAEQTSKKHLPNLSKPLRLIRNLHCLGWVLGIAATCCSKSASSSDLNTRRCISRPWKKPWL